MSVVIQPQRLFISSVWLILKRGCIKVEAMVGVQHDWIQHWRILILLWSQFSMEPNKTGIRNQYHSCFPEVWKMAFAAAQRKKFFFCNNYNRSKQVRNSEIKKFTLWLAHKFHFWLVKMTTRLCFSFSSVFSSFLVAGANDNSPDWTQRIYLWINIQRTQQKKGVAAKRTGTC